ncbi:MAG: histidine phosphatase family protein, partial [Actinobacteria bacterium]|nr:histidine phosphatase family protein [Actinomycetota bacterium]
VGGAKEGEPIKGKEGQPDIIPSKDLRTFDFHELEGEKQTPEANKKIHDNIINRPDEPMTPNGESFNDAANRGISFVKKLIDTFKGNAVVTTHNSMFGLIKLWNDKGRPETLDKDFREEYTKQDNTNPPGSKFEIETPNGKITVVRHGETTDNQKGLFRREESPLTEKGIQEANQLGQDLKGQKVDAIFSSDIKRAIDTSKKIQEQQTGRPESSQKTNVEGEEEEGLTNIKNAVNDTFIKGKFGSKALDDIINKLPDTDVKKAYKAVKEKIESHRIDPKDVRNRVLTEKSASSADQVVLLYDMAQLKGREKSLREEIINAKDEKTKESLQRQLVDVQNDMMDNALANRYIGRDWHNLGEIRKLWVNKSFDLSDMRDEYMASKGIGELTPEQEKEIKDFHDKIKNLEAERDKAKSDLDKAITENESLKMANLKLQELKDKVADQKRKDRGKKAEDAIQKSNERIQKAKDELRKLRGNLGAGVDPRVAGWITKIAAEKVYQGVVKLEELVKQVLDTVKDMFPEWTEKDVRHHLFGEKIDTEKYYEAGREYDKSNENLKEKIRAYNQLQKEFALKQFQWQRDRRSDIMAKRPLKERILDGILRWQRFAVLTYPTTLLKLGGVVVHQIALKPIKFLIQKGWASILPKSITSKQMLWGNPTWRSLGKYYSAFVRNFSLANLKEQFSGIDTKEILYGKSYMYDEWAAAKGLLEIPGRSHGYIKSFIKNPEFKFAQENIATHYISKMAEIEGDLKKENLSEDKKTELQDEYKNWDITDPDVMAKVNKLSLEHGRWSILLNDNKFVDKFRNWADQKDIGGALIRSELPIVKIPVNYVSRAFATKYGLIRAIVGKGRWESKENHFPGMIEMIYKGTKDLTPEQADLFGRTLTIGTIGASFFLMGYLNRKKIKYNDDGSADIFGVHFNRNLIHSPELESFFSGAETGNTFDSQKNKNGWNWMKSFAESDIDIAKKSPFASMLKYGFLPNVAAALISKDKNKIPGKITDAIGKKISDMVIPGFVKQSASALDTGKPGFHLLDKPVSRWPSGSDAERFWQMFEMGIPGLRKNVPATNYKSYTDEDYQRPAFKRVKEEWKKELPNTSLKYEKVKNSGGKVVSDYSQDIQDKYLEAHKDALEKELEDVFKW